MTSTKDKYLQARVESRNQRMQYVGLIPGREEIAIDYTPPLGDDSGATSLELLLLSLGSCVCSTLGVLLRNEGWVIEKISCGLTGTRRQEHPTGFESIALELDLVAAELDAEAVAKAIALAGGGICPVWAMLKDSVAIKLDYSIIIV